MAGVVKAHVEVFKDGSCDVMPDECPVERPHEPGEPRCYHIDRDGSRRSCIFWCATMSPNQRAERIDVTALHTRAVALGARTVTCQVKCDRQKANRPPGC